jgi:hypothetical protein
MQGDLVASASGMDYIRRSLLGHRGSRNSWNGSGVDASRSWEIQMAAGSGDDSGKKDPQQAGLAAAATTAAGSGENGGKSGGSGGPVAKATAIVTAIAALVGALAVLAAALINLWEKLFGKTPAGLPTWSLIVLFFAICTCMGSYLAWYYWNEPKFVQARSQLKTYLDRVRSRTLAGHASLAYAATTILCAILLVSAIFWLGSDMRSKLSGIQKAEDQQLANIRDLLNRRLGTTEYVNTFSENMNSIIDLIENTKKSLVIATDFARYGVFSKPEKNGLYEVAIQKVIAAEAKPTVTFIIYSRAHFKSAAAKQFNKFVKDRSEFDKFKATEKFKKFVEANKDAKTGTVEEFIDYLRKLNFNFSDYISNKFSNTNHKFSLLKNDNPMPVFIWLSDDIRCIFSFYTSGEDAREISFETTNPALIATLKAVFEDSRKQSSGYDASG